jgi:hypothetical protein
LSWLFGRRGLDDLITCMISAEHGRWTVIWVSDGHGQAPAGFTAKSLTEAVSRATQAVAALYSEKPQAATAELQFAIYPWPGGGKVILDLQTSIDGFAATALDNSQSVSGPDLESLVGKAEQSMPDFASAMFRWIRPIRELDTPPTAS